MARWFIKALIVCGFAVCLVTGSFLVANEIGGGFMTRSHIYMYTFRPNNQPAEDTNCYWFAQVQIVHELRLGTPVQRAVVRLHPDPGNITVVYDAKLSPVWTLDGIRLAVDTDYLEIPAVARAAWSEAMRRQLEAARDRGASAAEEAVDHSDDSYLMPFGYKDEGRIETYQLPDESMVDATVVVRGPGMAVYSNQFGSVLTIWIVLMTLCGFISSRIWKRVRGRHLKPML